ncbi:cyclase family protein [Ruminococcaceae bacterium OttesenSCG-928-O06]|nr:cyclase family protein [Ruminococcaceae bacterium OttesenSCG-928-O06]
MKLVDLSVSIVSGLPVDPPIQIPKITYVKHKDKLAISSYLEFFPGLTEEELPEGEAWATELMQIATHAGTHMDAPWHFHSTMNGGEPSWSIDEVPLEWCIGNGVVVDATDKPNGYVLTSADFIEYFKKMDYTLKPGDIVLLHTTAPTAWGKEEYLVTGCGVGREGTLWLIDQGVRCVGTDAWSWDAPLPLVAKVYEKTKDPSIVWEGHKAGREKAYVQMEKLANLDKIPKTGFTFIGFPVKIERASAGWIRAVAMLED